MRKMCDGKRPADGFVLDVGGAGVGEIGGPLPAARKMISDQRRDDTSVLAMDLHQKAVSYRRVQDLVQASIRSHEALLGECQKQLDGAHSQSLEALDVRPAHAARSHHPPAANDQSAAQRASPVATSLGSD